jgi:hypothetical protein
MARCCEVMTKRRPSDDEWVPRETKACVGRHWSKYADNSPADLTTDPSDRDSNKGIVTSRHEPYERLLAGMKEMNREVYALADHFDGR